MKMNLKKISKVLSNVKISPKTGGLIVFAIMLVFVVFTAKLQYEIYSKNETRAMDDMLMTVKQNIDQALKNCYSTTLSLALTVDKTGIPNNFENVAAELIKSNSVISSVQLVPDGIIKYVYPLKGNETLIGYDILNDPIDPIIKIEAERAINERNIYFAGPFELKQGGQGIVGRLPIFIESEFWGFAAVVIQLEKLIETSQIKNIANNSFVFQFSKIDPITGRHNFYLDYKFDFKNQKHLLATIPDGDWNLFIFKKQETKIISELLYPIVLGILLSIVTAFLAMIIFKKPFELKKQLLKQAQKLLKSEMLYKTIFDQAAVGIAKVSSADKTLTEINSRFYDILGYSQNELKNITIFDILHVSNLHETKIDFNNISNKIVNNTTKEKIYLHKNGKHIFVNETLSSLWHNSDNTDFVLIIEDITARKNSERQILASEQQFKSLFDDSPIPLWLEDFSDVKKYLSSFDLIGKPELTVRDFFNNNPEIVDMCISKIKIVDFNQRCLELHKTQNKKELIDNFYNIFTKASLNACVEQLISICIGKTYFEMDSQIKTIDNTIKDVYVRWNIIRGAEESLNRVIITTQDITERKSIQKKILESQQRVNALIQSIDGIVWEFDLSSNQFTFISEKITTLLGYKKEEWLRNVEAWKKSIYYEDLDFVLQKFDAKNISFIDYDFEYRIHKKDNTIVWLRDILNVVFDEEGHPKSLRGIMIDITRSKEAENDLNNSYKLVIEQNKRLSNFSHIVSHNLRTHSSNIQSIIYLLDITTEEIERNELLIMLKQVSENLNDTMNKLNEITDIQNQVHIDTTKVNLAVAVDKIEYHMNDYIKREKAIIIKKISPLCIFDYHPAYLENILFNFISNAIKFKHPQRNPIITLTGYIEGKNIVLEIKDNGMGIDLNKDSEKLFGLFKTLQNNPNNKGFGLFISKSQIEAMGGKITVESNLNEGSIFKIYF